MSSADSSSTAEVMLGFLEDAEPWRLLSPQFPSKVGGKPAWLSQSGLPSLPALECEICRLPMAFLLQVYAPISGHDSCFHRTLFLFCCKTRECYTYNDSRCMKVFRSQLPRSNEFYAHDPPSDEPPCDHEQDQSVLSPSGIKLCWVCGSLGNKACSRCHSVTYCGKHHQTLHWKHSHKKECCSQEASISTTSSFLFPESELATEPEEEGEEKAEEEDKETKDAEIEQERTSSALTETDLEEMAMHETEDNVVFQRFKKKTAPEPHQVLRYSRGGSPLWVSSKHIPSHEDIPACTCGAKRTFEFQVMPQLLNNLSVDSTGASIDWGTLAIYTCSNSCNHDDQYCLEFIWKQDFSSDEHTQIKPT
ncbi:programmed cell death protein 2 isoform X2 [Notolabrus celidotus]|uniref:programmed cell death protein 2 isoform X2 n=1 Tax=Notolabrus celidotus TaxID=1203425 RepID=UPI00148FF811|nr:programmed cell death protein 2 isoform X2 [Notolabrus celidotus]